MTSIGRITRESASLRDRVTNSIREAILSGELQPGQKLIERQLCSSLDISRTLLREALPLLQAEGLIHTVVHKGPSVALIDADEVREIYQVRRELEALAAREFAKHASDEQIRELREQMATLMHPDAAGNVRNLLSAKAGFYSVLFEGCNNQVIGRILTQLNNRVILYKKLSLSVDGRLPHAIAELDAVVTAIESRDAIRAAELCVTHIENSERNLLSAFSDEEDIQPD